MLGIRIREARERAGLTQAELGAVLDRTGGLIGKVETGHSGLLWTSLGTVARVLHVSADWLLGLTNDPKPADERVVDDSLVDYVPVHRSATIAGATKGNVFAQDSGVIPFRRAWLDLEGIDPDAANVFRVHGDSMEPTLTHGSAILVDYQRKDLRQGGIFVFKQGASLLVKRANFDWSWWFTSDNPKYGRIALREEAYIFGEVKWNGRVF
jgi:phage repressor protein C with HTH and peptisase S24 domain